MSSLEVSDYEDNYDPRQEFEDNRNALLRYYDQGLIDIRNSSKALQDDFLNDMLTEIKAFEVNGQDILARYTMANFNTTDRYNELQRNLSDMVLRVREKMNALLLGQQQFESNRNALSQYYDQSLKDIRDSSKALQDDFLNDMLPVIRALEANGKDILDKYALKSFNAANRYTELQGKLSNMVLGAREKMKALLLEQQQSKQRISQCLDASQGLFTGELATNALSTFASDVNELKQAFEAAQKETSIRVKVKNLDNLLDKIQKLAEHHGFARSIDLSGLEEQKSAILSPKHKHEDGLDVLRQEINYYAELIRDMDIDTYEAVCTQTNSIEQEKHVQRLKVLRDDIKLRFGRLKEDFAFTRACKQHLEQEMIDVKLYKGANEITSLIERLLAQKFILRKEYETIIIPVREFIQKALKVQKAESRKKDFSRKVQENLRKLDYVVISDDGKDDVASDLDLGKIVYFDTRWDDYKVMTKMNERGELITRLVRFIAYEEEKQSRTNYQRQKDIEIANKWCKDYDQFRAQLLRDGIRLNVKVRREPEDEELLYVVNDDIARRTREKFKAKPVDAVHSRQK